MNLHDSIKRYIRNKREKPSYFKVEEMCMDLLSGIEKFIADYGFEDVKIGTYSGYEEGADKSLSSFTTLARSRFPHAERKCRMNGEQHAIGFLDGGVLSSCHKILLSLTRACAGVAPAKRGEVEYEHDLYVSN